MVPLLYAYRLWSTPQAPDLSNGLDEEPTVVPEPTPKKLPHPTFRCQFGHTHRVTRITDGGAVVAERGWSSDDYSWSFLHYYFGVDKAELFRQLGHDPKQILRRYPNLLTWWETTYR